MVLEELLKNQVIALDTSPFIYFVEENPAYLETLQSIFEANKRGDLLIVTSTISLAELLVLALKEKRNDLVHRYVDILRRSSGIELLSVRSDIAFEAARLRAAHNLRTPDAIQIAAGLAARADLFLTNDAALARVSEIPVVVLKELARLR